MGYYSQGSKKVDLSVRGTIYNIQRYSVHDGPGIRTIVFFKGCPLRCIWCSNPEGLSPERDLIYYRNLCKKCLSCVSKCPHGAISEGKDGQGVDIDRVLCARCGTCAGFCCSDALRAVGREASAQELLDDIAKDNVFYKRSGGGLTQSGGEPLSQPEFSAALLEGARALGINTALETSCCAPEHVVRRVLPLADHVFIDLKLCDSRRHQKAAGFDNGQILSNIRLAAEELPKSVNLVLRMPVVPSVNDDEDNIRQSSEFILSLARPLPLELLAYHEFAKSKYSGLGKEYEPEAMGIVPPSKERMGKTADAFRRHGVTIINT